MTAFGTIGMILVVATFWIWPTMYRGKSRVDGVRFTTTYVLRSMFFVVSWDICLRFGVTMTGPIHHKWLYILVILIPIVPITWRALRVLPISTCTYTTDVALVTRDFTSPPAHSDWCLTSPPAHSAHAAFVLDRDDFGSGAVPLRGVSGRAHVLPKPPDHPRRTASLHRVRWRLFTVEGGLGLV